MEVYTGAESNTEMSGNVYITLVGDRGDTGRRKLLQPITSTSDQKFRPEQVVSVQKLLLYVSSLHVSGVIKTSDSVFDIFTVL